MTHKEHYISESKNLPLFHQPFWLNTATNNAWDVALVKKGDSIIASMPYCLKNDRIMMPSLTHFLGPHIWPDNYKNYYTQLSSEHKILQELLKQLPDYTYFEQRWHYNYQNWLPFYWNGFKQTTKYTYVLENINDIDSIWKGLKDNAKNEINKAEKELTVYADNDISTFYKITATALKKKGIDIPYSLSFLENLYNTCVENNATKLLWAKNSSNEIQAGVLLVFDKNTCYYLLGSSTEAANTFALRLLVWCAIKDCSKTVNKFDFEGSMIEGIENFFRGFGAQQKGYFEITKTKSKLMQIKQGLSLIKQALVR